MRILFCIEQNDFLLVSDDGFKNQGASGFIVGMIQDYVVTEVYWLLVHFFLDLYKGKITSNEFCIIKFVTGFHVQGKQFFNLG